MTWQLSGGMRRRCARQFLARPQSHRFAPFPHASLSIGVALCGASDIVFLDEPSTGLDPVSRANIWRIVARAAAKGTSILLTTHAFEEASALARRIAIMHAGELRAIDTVPSSSPCVVVVWVELTCCCSQVAGLVRTAGKRLVLRITFEPSHVDAARAAGALSCLRL